MGVNNSAPILIHPTQDKAQMSSYINENFRKIADGFNPFQMSDGTNNIINIGKDSVGNYTMKVAKPGNNAFDADDADLIFNSNQNVFKLVSVGSVTMPTYSVTSGAGWNISSVAFPPSATVAHGQGRVPLVVAYMRVTGPGGKTSLALPYTSTGIVGTGFFIRDISVAVDATYISFNDTISTNGSIGVYTGGGGTIDYYIYQESAQ